jgi:two-component system, NtrC family, sensor kinase
VVETSPSRLGREAVTATNPTGARWGSWIDRAGPLAHTLLLVAAVSWWLAHDPAAVGTAPWLAVPVGLAAFVAGWVLHFVFTRDAGALTDAARRWASGDLAHRVPPLRSAWLSGVAGALNQMAAAIQRHDESRRLRLDEATIRSEKLATTGRLAAGVAHEINNPLGGILLCGNLLLENMPARDPRRDTMVRIVEQAARAKEIVVGLLDFARQAAPNLERHDLNRVVLEVLRLLDRQPQFRAMRLRTELSTAPLWVRVDRLKIHQVLVNILLNALDAMREGGQLTIRTGFSERTGFCRVAVSDTGSGIRDEDMAHLFEPFFTTKDVGRGLGLGLAIAYGIVTQHGGTIDVQSQWGVGSTFRVVLPQHGEE